MSEFLSLFGDVQEVIDFLSLYFEASFFILIFLAIMGLALWGQLYRIEKKLDKVIKKFEEGEENE